MKASTIQLSVFSFIFLIGLSACDNPKTEKNTEMKIEQRAETMGETSDKAGVEVEDATITTKTKAAFLAESTISSLDINVTTTDGVVTLTGVANSLASSQKATEIAREISGVKEVSNQLVVK